MSSGHTNFCQESGGAGWVVIVSDIPLAPSDHGSRVRSRQLVEVLRGQGYRVAYILWERYAWRAEPLVAEVSALVDDLIIIPFEEISQGPLPIPGILSNVIRIVSRLFPRRVLRRLGHYQITNRLLGRLAWLGYKEPDIQDWQPESLSDAVHVMAMKYPIVATIVQYAYLAPNLLPVQAHGILGIVDTIDVLHSRMAQFRKQGLLPDGFMICKNTEACLLQMADYVVAIQPREAEILRTMVSPAKVLIVEHGIAPAPCDNPANTKERSVTLVGSDNPNNRHGLEWFLAKVWPHVLRFEPLARLNVYGRLSEWPVCRGPRVKPLGYIGNIEEAYSQSLVAINPVRVGTGLKIKTVEGLAYGRALVATSVGAEGLEDGAGTAFIKKDDPLDFAESVAHLLRDSEEALRLGKCGRQYAENRFGLEQTYKPLLEVIKPQVPHWQYQIAHVSGEGGIRRPRPPRPQLPQPWNQAWNNLHRGSIASIEELIRSTLIKRKKVEIEFVTASSQAGSAELQTINLAVGLNQLGFCCRMRVSESNGTLVSETKKAGLDVLPLAAFKNLPPKKSGPIYHLIACHMHDLLGIQQTVAKNRANWLISYQLTFTSTPPEVKEHAKSVIRRTWPDAGMVCFVSDHDRRMVRAVFGLDGIAQCVVWNGAELDVNHEFPRLDRAPNISGVFNWLWCAEFRRHQRPDLLVEAIRQVVERKTARSIQVWMVGNGPLEKQIRQEIQEMGLDKVIHVNGWQSKEEEIFNRADGLLLTSDFEGLPIGVVKAMHTGMPIVTTATGGVSEVLRHGREALLCAAGDSSGLANNICCIMDDPALAQRLALSARQVASDVLTHHESVVRHAMLYLSMTSN